MQWPPGERSSQVYDRLEAREAVGCCGGEKNRKAKSPHLPFPKCRP